MNILEGLAVNRGDELQLVLKVSSEAPFALVLTPDRTLDLVSLVGVTLPEVTIRDLEQRTAPNIDDAPDWQPAVVELMGHKVLMGETAWQRGMLLFREKAGAPVRQIGRSAIHTHHTGISVVDVQRLRLRHGTHGPSSGDIHAALYPERIDQEPLLGMKVELRDEVGMWGVSLMDEQNIILHAWESGVIRAVNRDEWTDSVHTLHNRLPKLAAGMVVEFVGANASIIVLGQHNRMAVFSDGTTLDTWDWTEHGEGAVTVLVLPHGWPENADLPELTADEVEQLKDRAEKAVA